MSTIPSASSTVAASAVQTAAATAAAEAAAAQSIISGSTGNSSLDVSSLITSLVNAKVAGQTATLNAQQTNDNTKLSAIGALQAALSALQAGVLPLSNSTTLGQFTATADGTGLKVTATSGATAGVYSIGVTQIASAQTLSSTARHSRRRHSARRQHSAPARTARIWSCACRPRGASNTISVGVTGVANDAGLSSLGVTSTPGTNGAASTYTSAVNAWTQTASAQDAMFTVDGTAGTSSSNSVTTAVQGLTLNLTAAAIGSPVGKTQTLTVAQNTSSAASAINQLRQPL